MTDTPPDFITTLVSIPPRPGATDDRQTLRLPRLDRRDFLRASACGLGFAAIAGTLTACGGGGGAGIDPTPLPQPTPTPTPLPPEVPVLPPASRAVQALKRTSFGVTEASLAEAERLGLTAFLEQQLDPQRIDDRALEDEIARRYPRANLSTEALRADFPENQALIVGDLLAATLLRRLASPRQLFETAVEMWHDHFSVHLLNGAAPLFHPAYDREVIRDHALGKFPDLLAATTRSPAMLYYLDNFLNFAASPQENYARELLELHTLGVDGGYTEADIKEVARCFTGWTLDFRTGAFRFSAAQHDTGAKTVLGEPIPAGGGLSDGERVLEILAAHPSTARHVARRLCRRYLTDMPDETLVARLANTYTATGGDIAAMLSTLFADPAFTATTDAKFLRPSEFIGQLLRAAGPADTLRDTDGVQILFRLHELLGQVPYYWVPPNGYPDVASYWATTSGLLNRWRIAFTPGSPAFASLFAVTSMVGDADTVNDILEAIRARLLFRPLNEDDRQLLIADLSASVGSPADRPLSAQAARAVALRALALLVSSAYFQIR